MCTGCLWILYLQSKLVSLYCSLCHLSLSSLSIFLLCGKSTCTHHIQRISNLRCELFVQWFSLQTIFRESVVYIVSYPWFTLQMIFGEVRCELCIITISHQEPKIRQSLLRQRPRIKLSNAETSGDLNPRQHTVQVSAKGATQLGSRTLLH